MILRRVFPFILAPRLHPRLILTPSCSFSTKQQQQPKVEQTEEAAQPEQVIAQAEQAVVQQAQQLGFKQPRHKNQKYNNANRFPNKNNIGVVDQFLMFERKEVDWKDKLEEFKNIQNIDQLKSKIQEMQSSVQRQKNLQLEAYQKKININPQQLIYRSFNFDGWINQENKPAPAITRNIKSDTLKRFTMQQVQEHFKNGAYKNDTLNKQFVGDILKTVIDNHQRNGLLNLLYEKLAISDESWAKDIVVSAHDLNKIVDLVAAGQLHHVNPLKFYWFAMHANPTAKNEYTQLIIKQFNKLSIDGGNLSKDLKSSYYYFGEQLSKNILLKIISTTRNLIQATRLWVLTMIIASRLKSSNENQSQTALNFNDIFTTLKDKEQSKNYFFNTLPRLLFENGDPHLYETYKKALKYFTEKSKDAQIRYSELEQNNNIILSPEKFIEVSYPFKHDLSSHIVKLCGKKKEQLVQAGLGFTEYGLVQSIIKGEYHKALKYYADNFVIRSDDVQQVARFQRLAKAESQDTDHQALFTLKEIFKESKRKFAPDYDRLSQAQLQKIMYRKPKGSNFFNNRPGYKRLQRSNEEGQNNRTHSSEGNDKVQDRKQKWGNKKNKSSMFKQSTEQNQPNTQQQRSQRANQKVSLFGKKKPVATFCSVKDTDGGEGERNKQQESSKQYENYRKIVKQTQKSAQPVKTQSKVTIFDFSKCKTIVEVEQQFKKHINKINEGNINEIIQTYSNIPVVNKINTLIKYYFFLTNINNNIEAPKGLNVQFNSTAGDISKDYGEYLKGCAFGFALPDQIYESMLEDHVLKTQRHKFKRIVAHILLFKKNISEKLISQICDICSKQKIGLTLLEIVNLINVRESTISYESLKKITTSIQTFKDMESDLLQFVRKYCNRANIKIQTKLFEPYISNLVATEKYEALNDFFSILREQFKIKQYQINKSLSPEQNIKAEKLHKELQSEQANKQLFEMIRIVSSSFKPRTKIPSFIPQILDIYFSKKKNPTNANEYAVALIVNSQNEQKYISLLEQIKKNLNENNETVLDAQIRSMMLFSRNLKDHIDKILKATLYEKQIDLTQPQLKNFGYIFKDIDTPGAYTEYLEYILKKQPAITQEIKNLYYKVFNSTSDDFSKNQISGLLDYLFNPSREKDRVQYKKIKLQEQRKYKLLRELTEKKPQPSQSQPVSEQKDKEKDKSTAKTVQKQDAKTTSQKRRAKKEEKKEKKELKKAKSQEKDLKDPKDKKLTNLIKDQNVSETKIVDNHLTKINAKFLQKLSTSMSYDKNNKVVYHQKLWKRDLRRRSVVTFTEGFMQRYELTNDEDGAGDARTNRSKVKSPVAKDAGKKAVAKQAKKK